MATNQPHAENPASAAGSGSSRRHARRLARTALACCSAAIGLVAAATSLRGAVVAAAIAIAALALAAAGVWWALAHHGIGRTAGVLTAVIAMVAMVALYAASTAQWLLVLGAALAWAAGLACGHAALRADRAERGGAQRHTPAPRHPVLIMNPASGDGKVERFGLVQKAEALGCRVVLLDTSHHQDVAAIARQALADGADLLGVAGGDGTQALVAGVAAEHGVPFLVISAGTRNHFAMDLGLDRDDPSRCLDALQTASNCASTSGRWRDGRS